MYFSPMKNLILLFIFLNTFAVFGQKSFFKYSDTLNKKRLIGTSIGIGTIWAGSMTGLYSVWYKKEDQSKFHFFDDHQSWFQMDKIGHTYTAWKIAELTTNNFRWSGLDHQKSLIIGSSIAWGYQATLEIFDGFSSDWGFSWSDMAANTTGVGLYLGQELIWKEQRIVPKFSVSYSPYAKYRPEVLGNSFSERILKDYNGQSYWLSISPGSFMKSTKYPKWLCFSLGYSIDQRLKGDEKNFEVEGIEFKSQREFLFSLDIDFSKINVKKPWLKMILKQINHLKVPFPTIIFTKSGINGSWLYF